MVKKTTQRKHSNNIIQNFTTQRHPKARKSFFHYILLEYLLNTMNDAIYNGLRFLQIKFSEAVSFECQPICRT